MQAIQEDPNNKHFIPEGYAVMLYFDHRLARIVRHLFNPNLTFWGKTPELADFTTIESRYKSLPKKNPYLYNYDLELKDQTPIIAIEQIDVKHSPNVPAVVPKTFFDGKINSRMITAFYYHLYSDWLMKGHVYDTTDFLTIRQVGIGPTIRVLLALRRVISTGSSPDVLLMTQRNPDLSSVLNRIALETLLQTVIPHWSTILKHNRRQGVLYTKV